MSKLLNFAKSSEAAVQTLKDSAPRWSDRTLRVVVDPTPQTFAERRSVLQALKQSGQIEVFKANPHQAHEFMVVTNDAATAQKLSGTLSYSFSGSKLNTSDRTGSASTIQSLATNSRPSINAQTMQEDSESVETKRFEMEIQPMPEYRHSRIVRGDPYTHRWPSTFRNHVTFRSLALQKSVPTSTAKEGLTQWLWSPPSTSDDARRRQRWDVQNSMPGNWLASKLNANKAKAEYDTKDD